MKKIAGFALVAMLLPAAPSWAADLLVGETSPAIGPHVPPATFYPPTPPSEAPPPWEGAYIGGNIDWLRAHFGHPVRQYLKGKIGNTLYDISAYEESESGEIIGGIQVGYNWNIGNNIIAGLEADFQISNLEGFSNFQYDGYPDTNINIYDKLHWFGTIRGRLGYAFSPKILVYGTGGLAYGRVDTDLEHRGDYSPWPGMPFSGKYETSETHVGWAVGAGTEYSFHKNWSLRAEYLYIDLGEANVYDYQDEDMGLTIDKDVNLHTLRLGLNYRF
jgi:outer membrane immunogenic protein